MYTPARSAAVMASSPFCALTARPLTMICRPASSMSGTHRDQHALAQAGLELLTEQREGGMHRHVGRRAEEADGGHLVRERHRLQAEGRAGRVGHRPRADQLAYFDDLVEVALEGLPVDDPLEDALQPRAALAAGHALAAALVGVEAHERQRSLGDVGGL